MIGNPYFIENDNNYTPTQKKYMKENNIYIFTILSHLIKYNGETKTLSSAYKKRILSTLLYHPDIKTGLDTNKLGEKLKALIIAMDKPENREKFCNSYFYAAMSTLTTGATQAGNENQEWAKYQKTSRCPFEFKNKTPLSASLDCYKEDPSMPVGLNMMTFIDEIIQKDEFGKYKVIDTTAEKGDLMCQAVIEQVKSLKSNEKFKQSFENPNLNQNYYGDDESSL